MPTIRLTPDDMTKMRFAYRPLMEIPLSYRVLINPEYQSPHHRWVEQAHRALYGMDLPYMSALITESGPIADFLTPTPLTRSVYIEDDIEALLGTSDVLIRKNVQTLIQAVGESEMRLFYLTHPRDALHCLVEELRLYWHHTLAQSWSNMMAILDGDILYRAQRLALEGPDALLPDLHPLISYQPSEIELSPICCPEHCPCEVSLCGEGLQLVPTVFDVTVCIWKVPPDWHPMIGYGARGVGLYSRETRAVKPLEVALGVGRAKVLQSLRIPATTGELAHKLGLTAGGISQHLDRLRRAGLVEPHRSGKRVYYQLTQRGAELLALFERMN